MARLRDTGHEPDYRFSFANERTFLAWIRTALALDAAGLAVVQLLPPFAVPYAREAIGGSCVVLATLVAASSYRRWERNERALRTDAPLPVTSLPRLLGAGVAVASLLTLLVLLLAGRGGT
jgi:putative membrane protein